MIIGNLHRVAIINHNYRFRFSLKLFLSRLFPLDQEVEIKAEEGAQKFKRALMRSC